MSLNARQMMFIDIILLVDDTRVSLTSEFVAGLVKLLHLSDEERVPCLEHIACSMESKLSLEGL